jgi:hypothetical protein
VAISQNAIFYGPTEKSSEFDHPAGYSLVVLFSSMLKGNGWTVENPENWRDTGWSLILSNSDSELELVLSELESEKWMMQVAPSKVPTLGMFSRIFGKKEVEPPSASPTDCFDVSVLLSEFLQGSDYKDTLWCWDDFPEKSNSSEQPQSANDS